MKFSRYIAILNLFVIMCITNIIIAVKISNNKNFNGYIDNSVLTSDNDNSYHDDITSIENVLKKLNYIGSKDFSKNRKNNFFRFKEKSSVTLKNDSENQTGDIDTSDSNDLNINMNEDSIFSKDDSSKDKELERKEGLKNGNVLFNNKRTLNVETSEFADYYYEIGKKI